MAYTQKNETTDYNVFEDLLENYMDQLEELEVKCPRKSAPAQFPTNKPGRYSKDRRFIPRSKKSDKGKIHSQQGKGARHKKREKILNES